MDITRGLGRCPTNAAGIHEYDLDQDTVHTTGRFGVRRILDMSLVTVIGTAHRTYRRHQIGAHGGEAGLERIREEPPDLVLLDLMMPGVDGWEVYRQLQADPALSQIPVIVVTAKAQQIDVVLGLHIARVADYIVKPFSFQQLLESIRRVLGEGKPEGGG